jgi:predicted dienelactone hydrolase
MSRLLFILGCGVVSAVFCLGMSPVVVGQDAYDPLAITEAIKTSKNEPIDLTIDDTTRKRQIPIRVYLPLDKAAAPVVMFSHGLGGSREGAAYLGRHWSARGVLATSWQR